MENKEDEIFAEKIKELRTLIMENNLNARTDDEYLLRYLKNKYSSVQYAFKRLRRYENFVDAHKDWNKISLSKFRMMLESGTINMLIGTDKNGRHISYCRPGLWQTDKYSAEDLLKISFVLTNAALVKCKDDFVGLTIMYDFDGFGFKHLGAISPKFAKDMVNLILECVPFMVFDIHVCRQSKLFSIVYACFKPFLKEKAKQMIRCYGHDLSMLHEYIDKSVLPKELGGHFHFQNPAYWMDLLESREIMDDLKKSGFVFVD